MFNIIGVCGFLMLGKLLRFYIWDCFSKE